MDNTINRLFHFRSLYILTQLFVLLIMWLFLDDPTIMSQAEYIRLYCYWNIASYVFLFYKEVRLSDGLQPIIFIALVTIQFVGLNGLSIANELKEGETFYFGTSNITPYLGLSLWFLSLEHILILSGYYFIDYKNRRNPLPDPAVLIQETNLDYEKWALRLYAFIWCLRIIDYIIPLASLTSVLVAFADKGQILVLTFLSYKLLKSGSNKILKLYWSITVLEIILVLGHGMKEEILTNLVPYLIYLLIGYKSGKFTIYPKILLKLTIVGVFAIYVVFPYVAIFRHISSKKNLDWSEVEVTEVFSSYADYILKEGEFKNTDVSEMSTDYMMMRAGSIGCNAWSIHYAQTHKPVYSYFLYTAGMAIPRFLWPDKPPNVVGNMMYRLSRGSSNWEQEAINSYYAGEVNTSVTIGFIGGIYFSLGLFAALFFPFLPVYLSGGFGGRSYR